MDVSPEGGSARGHPAKRRMGRELPWGDSLEREGHNYPQELVCFPQPSPLFSSAGKGPT